MEPVILRAVLPVYRLGILPGDRIVFDPAAPHLFTRYRPVAIPNPGAVLLALEEGALEPVESVNPTSSVEQIRQAVGASPPALVGCRRARWRQAQYLELVR